LAQAQAAQDAIDELNARLEADREAERKRMEEAAKDHADRMAALMAALEAAQEDTGAAMDGLNALKVQVAQHGTVEFQVIIITP
jgi:broad specificity phosphatase PhoE